MRRVEPGEKAQKENGQRPGSLRTLTQLAWGLDVINTSCWASQSHLPPPPELNIKEGHWLHCTLGPCYGLHLKHLPWAQVLHSILGLAISWEGG